MKLISFEGIEGVGKSTQIDLLKKFLISKNFNVEVYREPGATDFGEKIRDILLNSNSNISDNTELLLMFSSRSELINHIAKSKADYILLDRYYDASIAYQGYGRGISLEIINSLIGLIKCPEPDSTILLDLSIEDSIKRKINDKKDRIESSGINFFDKVRNGYLKLASDHPKRFLVIDALLDKEHIHKLIVEKIK